MIPLLASLVVLTTLWPAPSTRRPAPSAAIATQPIGHRRRRLAVRVCAVAIAGLLLGGPVVGLVVAASVVGLHRWKTLRRRRRASRRAAAAAPDVIDLLVATVRAGMSPLHGLSAISSLVDPIVGESLDLVVQRQSVGERFADSLTSLHPSLHHLGHSLARAERYGEPIAPLLDQLATDARHQRRRASETAARQLPVRLCVPLAVCTLPSFALLTIVPLLVGAFSSLSGSP
jgi:Flp pilus assembly protein TadB